MVVNFGFHQTKSALSEHWPRYAAELLGHLYLVSPMVLLANFIWLASMTLDVFAENVAANRLNPTTMATINFSRRQVKHFVDWFVFETHQRQYWNDSFKQVQASMINSL